MKKARIIAIFILLTVSMYIYNAVQARYILNKNIQISYSTSDYYFDVSIDVNTVSEFPATISITTKNNNGTNYTDTDLTYTIGVNNSNYTITANDGKNTRTLAGGNKRQETFAATINKIATDSSSRINLTFTVSKPYSETISKQVGIQTITTVSGNILNYAKGARVTYTTPTPYSCTAYKSINGGYTGTNSPINSALTHSQDSFWGAKNGWDTQGALENDDSKSSINLTHEGNAKASQSATTIYTGGSGTSSTIIINPRAYQGDISANMFKMSECYLASANSDGDVGNYKIYVSTSSDESVATNPNHSSWVLLTQGNLTQDAVLTKVYSGGQDFRYIKLELNSRSKAYMELAAIKVY